MLFRNMLFLIGALGSSAGAFAQTPSGRGRITDTQSVVVLPASQRPQIDTAAIRLPEAERHSKKQRHKIGIKVVPAPPPGRSWQEIRYSDSLGRTAP